MNKMSVEDLEIQLKNVKKSLEQKWAEATLIEKRPHKNTFSLIIEWDRLMTQIDFLNKKAGELSRELERK